MTTSNVLFIKDAGTAKCENCAKRRQLDEMQVYGQVKKLCGPCQLQEIRNEEDTRNPERAARLRLQEAEEEASLNTIFKRLNERKETIIFEHTQRGPWGREYTAETRIRRLDEDKYRATTKMSIDSKVKIYNSKQLQKYLRENLNQYYGLKQLAERGIYKYGEYDE